MNFVNNYVIVSLCAPSRAVFMTGMYPCKTRVVDNSTQANFDTTLSTSPHKLKTAGMYTAIIGKSHETMDRNGSYDWNFRFISVSSQGDKNIKWTRNNSKAKKAGTDTLITKIIIDTAIALIHRIEQPLFMLLSFRFPHTPTEVPPPFKTIFETDTISLGADTVWYSNWYPSFLYSLPPVDNRTHPVVAVGFVCLIYA